MRAEQERAAVADHRSVASDRLRSPPGSPAAAAAAALPLLGRDISRIEHQDHSRDLAEISQSLAILRLSFENSAR